jgi:hypothetical protein
LTDISHTTIELDQARARRLALKCESIAAAGKSWAIILAGRFGSQKTDDASSNRRGNRHGSRDRKRGGLIARHFTGIAGQLEASLALSVKGRPGKTRWGDPSGTALENSGYRSWKNASPELEVAVSAGCCSTFNSAGSRAKLLTSRSRSCTCVTNSVTSLR